MQGCTHVYTGNGKGKTTAMLGLALRAYGAGLRVYIGQFIKSGDFSEVRAVREFLRGMTIEQYGAGFVGKKPTAEDMEAAGNGLNTAIRALTSGLYDVVMLDEINVAVHCGLLSVADVLGLIENRPENVELVLTGRYAPAEVIESADLVSDIAEVKHYYSKGISARVGIEK